MDQLVRRSIAGVLGVVLWACSAEASAVLVPDDYATVQGAIDSGADTVRVRPGNYAESPVVDHAIVIEGVQTESRPRMGTLRIVTRTNSPRSIEIFRCEFSGPVVLETTQDFNIDRILFAECVLDSGLQNPIVWEFDDIGLLTIRNSRITGSLAASVGRVAMEADTVTSGGVSWRTENAALSIVDCWFQGGPGVAIGLRGNVGGNVARNRIANYHTGISADYADSFRCEENVITNCSMGIHVIGNDYIDVLRNEIYDCGVGISIHYDEYLTVRGNTIMKGIDHGIIVGAGYYPTLEDNVVGYRGGAGIHLDSNVGTIVRRNTVFENSGSGIKIFDYEPAEAITVVNNISTLNDAWGLEIPAGFTVTSECNDWFGNGLGVVTGIPVGSSDLQVDPLFCDVDSADVRLASTSPLANAEGCGQIGALPVGCSMTPTLMTMLRAEAFGRGALIQWQWGLGAPEVSWLERAESETGPWQKVPGSPRVENGVFMQVDENILPSQAYWYRVGWLDKNTRYDSPPVSFASAAAPATLRVVPSPGFGPLRVDWSMMRAADIAVQIHDLAGRKVAKVAQERFGPGDCTVRWDGRSADGSSIPAGWYLVRVHGSGIDLTQRFQLIR